MDSHLEYIFRRGVTEIIVQDELLRMLASGKKLRLKMGFDPSRPDIHLGHVVGMRKLRQFQELGHQVVLIVGDWTAQIGDPSGASQTRPMLTAEEVRANADTYMAQFFKVVDSEKTEVRWQTEWFRDFSLADVVKLTSKFTVAQLLAREDFSKRYQAGRPIAVTELLYPLLQAYDSVMIESDVEFGGIDQKFNCLMGRELQEMVGQPRQQVFLMPLLVGTEGRQKMSKSLDNYIAVEEPPNHMYGKVMSVPDHVMMDYFELLTDVPDEELSEMGRAIQSGSSNPMEFKKRLAVEIVTQFHSGDAAAEAEEFFESTVQRKQIPADIREIPCLREGGRQTIDLPGVLCMSGLVRSKSEARSLMNTGAIRLWPDGDTTTQPVTAPDRLLEAEVEPGAVVNKGKLAWLRLVEASRQD